MCENDEKSTLQISVGLYLWVQKYNKKKWQINQQMRVPQNMEFDAEGVPKWIPNRYNNSYKINATTGKEKDHENHCFSEW